MVWFDYALISQSCWDGANTSWVWGAKSFFLYNIFKTAFKMGNHMWLPSSSRLSDPIKGVRYNVCLSLTSTGYVADMTEKLLTRT